MKAKAVKIRKFRQYSEDFKKKIVSLFERGEYSVLQIVKLYGVGQTQVYNWIYKYSKFNEKGCRIVEMKESNQQKVKELQKKIKDLEQAVGQKQIKIEYLEKLIEIASKDLKIDLKKNSNTKRSNGSGITKRK
jgi:transposase